MCGFPEWLDLPIRRSIYEMSDFRLSPPKYISFWLTPDKILCNFIKQHQTKTANCHEKLPNIWHFSQTKIKDLSKLFLFTCADRYSTISEMLIII